MHATAIDAWLAFQLQLADYLADTGRLWAATGAFLASIPLSRWVARFIRAQGNVDHFTPTVRFILAIALLCGLAGIFIGGVLIPLAQDGRLENLDTGGALYRGGLASVWLLWGVMAWAIAIAFAHYRRFMAAACAVMWLTAYVASGLTMGAML